MNFIPTSLTSVILILLVSSFLAYRASYLHNKKIFRFSLLQILYLVIIPGVVMLLLTSYIRSIISLPLANNPTFSDSILLDTILLSGVLTYGGLAIHAVSKMLAHTPLRYQKSEASDLNKYFHLNFSHNLIYSGVLTVFVALSLLELNHQPTLESNSITKLILKGVFIGVGAICSMIIYTRSNDQYVGRWSDLKATFFISWVLVILLLYYITQSDPVLRQYELLLPMLLGLSIIDIANLGLIYRHFKLKKKSLNPLITKD